MKPLVLYSTNPYLKYAIAEKYYGHCHYVWCTVFDPRTHDKYGPHASVPPTSSPCEIYRRLQEEVSLGDRHSPKVEEARRNIIHGATVKLNEGVINEEQYKEIVAVIDKANLSDFRPLLYVIPYDRVADQLVEASLDERAHLLSNEYIIESLKRSDFDVIERS